MRLLPVLAIAALIAAPPAHGAWFGGEVLDSGVTALGSVDLERDGTGALTYLKGGQVFTSVKTGGVWTPPEAVAAGAGAAVVAAGPRHRRALAFVTADTLYGAVAPAGDAPQPWSPPVPLASGGGIGSLAIDMGVNGHAYVVWTSGLSADVRAARLDSGAVWSTIAAPLDIDPARSAGRGEDRPRVATGADGHAIVVWGEGGRVWERRLIGTRLSAVPQEAGEGTLPEVDVEDDSSFVPVAWRAPSGATVRRLVGSAFEAPWSIGGDAPDVAIDGRGMGFAVATSPAGEVLGLPLDDDTPGAVTRVDSAGAASGAATAVGELGEITVAWLSGGEVRGRAGDQQHDAREPPAPTFDAESVLSRPDLGAATPPALAGDGVGNAVAAFMQGDALVVADQDRPPGRPTGGTTELWKPRARPELRWRAGDEPWGPVTFAVFVDGVQVAVAPPGADRVRPRRRLRDGEHDWYVQATDHRGQVSVSEVRKVRVDKTKPLPRLRMRRGASGVRIEVAAKDAASGVARTKLTFPDGSSTTSRSLTRQLARGASLKLGVVDRAGNVARKRFRAP